MKQYFLAVLWLIIPGMIWAQEISDDEVPASVVKSFNKKYASAEVYAWSLNDKDLYVAEFSRDDMDHQAAFNEKGVWEYTQTVIDELEIPDKVMDTVFEAFSSPSIMQAELKETKSGERLYLLTVQDEVMDVDEDEEESGLGNNNSLYHLIVNADGQIIVKNSI